MATGIVNIWPAAAGPVAESFHRIEAAHPGRFLLGIGVGHPEAHQEYVKPIDALAELSAARSAGAHPYLTTPEHTARARELIGPEALLAPEHRVVLTTDE